MSTEANKQRENIKPSAELQSRITKFTDLTVQFYTEALKSIDQLRTEMTDKSIRTFLVGNGPMSCALVDSLLSRDYDRFCSVWINESLGVKQ